MPHCGRRTQAFHLAFCTTQKPGTLTLIAQHVVVGVPLIPRLRGCALQALQPDAVPPSLLALLHLLTQPRAVSGVEQRLQLPGARAQARSCAGLPVLHTCRHTHGASCS